MNMKNNLSTLALAIGLSALAGSSQLMAQETRETGNIPFSFQVGSEHLAAGDYVIARSSATGTLMLRNQDTRVAKLGPLQIPGTQNSKNESKLVFHKYGERYFLAEVWFGDDPTVHVLPMSKAEKEYAMDLGGKQPQTVYLAMR
jgi:hypothetical protein